MRRARRMGGFTLVEVLVATTLLSIVMLALGAALRTMGQAESRVDQRLQRADEMRMASQFLSSVLGRVSARKAGAPTRAGTSLYQFAGEPGALSWIGVMPARHGAGGRHYFRLAAEPSAAGRALVLRYAPWTPDSAFPDWNAVQSRVLASDVEGFALFYGDVAGNWSQAWRETDKLPTRVRIALRTGTAEWPPLVVALRQLPAGSRDGPFTVGAE